MSTHIISSSDFSSKEIRKAIWENSSSRIALVTSFWEGKHNVMTCEWFTQIQFNPPRYLIALVKGFTSVRYIEKSGEFGITFLSDDQIKLCTHAGNTSGDEIDKFSDFSYPHRPGLIIEPKMITEGVLALECKVLRTIEEEYVQIFIGEVVNAEYRTDKSPLQYHKGNYHKLGELIPR